MSGAPTNIQVFPLDDPRLARTLRGKLSERIGQLYNTLMLASDWADFKQRLGHLQGMREAIDICEQMEQERRQRES